MSKSYLMGRRSFSDVTSIVLCAKNPNKFATVVNEVDCRSTIRKVLRLSSMSTQGNTIPRRWPQYAPVLIKPLH